MNKFVVESGIPFASKGNIKYPFGEMNVGDSFLLPENIKNKVAAAVTKYAKEHNRKYSIRKVPDGYRCWRLK